MLRSRIVVAAAAAFALAATACRGEGVIVGLDGGLDEAAAGTCALEVVDASPALGLTRTLTSDWETGSCYELALVNEGDARLRWSVVVAIEPASATLMDQWNHAATPLGGGFEEWRGIAASNNIDLEIGATTTIGACFTC